jgi:hypothetical protein
VSPVRTSRRWFFPVLVLVISLFCVSPDALAVGWYSDLYYGGGAVSGFSRVYLDYGEDVDIYCIWETPEGCFSWGATVAWVEVDGSLYEPSSSLYSNQFVWDWQEANISYYAPSPAPGNWLAANYYSLGWDYYEAYWQGEGYSAWQWISTGGAGLGNDNGYAEVPAPPTAITQVSWYPTEVTAPGCTTLSVDSGVEGFEFYYTFNGNLYYQDYWPNGGESCIQQQDYGFFGTYVVTAIHSSAGGAWFYPAEASPPQPATVTIQGPPPPDFAVDVSPGSQTVNYGESTTYTIQIVPSGGFASAVTLDATNLPLGATAAFVPQTIVPGQTSTLTIQTSAASGAHGTTNFTVSGAGPAFTRFAAGSIQIAPTLTLTATGTAEVGKPTHFISLVNTGNVEITAIVNPPGAAAVTWTGGAAGADALHRVVDSAIAGTWVIGASIPSANAAVSIHVVDATPPPGGTATLAHTAAVNIPMASWAQYSSWGINNNGGALGIPYPDFNVDFYFSGDRWVFALRDVTGHSGIGVLAPGAPGRAGAPSIDLPVGNVNPFPQVAGMNNQQSRNQARSDLDTAGLVPQPGGGETGPPRFYYSVVNITQAHEDYHLNDFYGNFWPQEMAKFESIDVEAAAAAVIYNCSFPNTTTGAAAKAPKMAGWETQLRIRHNDAFGVFNLNNAAERRAHTFSNPMYIPIRNAIP